MLRPDAAIARPAAAQDGLTTREQLRHTGLSDRQIDLRIDAGIVEIVYEGVLRHTAAPFTQRTRLRAPLLACGPDAVLSHRSAAVLHGFDGIRRVRPELTICGRSRPRLADVTIHRTDTLDAIDRCVVDGLAATSRARTLLDLGAVVPYELVEHAVQVAIIQKLVTIEQLVGVLDRLGKPGRRGTATLRAVVREAIPDERLASMLEHALLQLIVRCGIEPPEPQFRFVCADGRVVVLDFAWPALRIAVEADGHRWHASRKQLESDLARRRSIVASGWSHYAYGWGDVHDRPAIVTAELLALWRADHG